MIKILLLSSIYLFPMGTNHQVTINKLWKKTNKLSDMLDIHLFLSSWASTAIWYLLDKHLWPPQITCNIHPIKVSNCQKAQDFATKQMDKGDDNFPISS
jgi:hypothetical protein